MKKDIFTKIARNDVRPVNFHKKTELESANERSTFGVHPLGCSGLTDIPSDLNTLKGGHQAVHRPHAALFWRGRFILPLLLAAMPAAAATNEMTGMMQKGLFEEEGNHNLPAAIEAYQNIITRFDEMRSVTATAIFRLGECYRKQGKTNEAVAQYQRLTREFRDQNTLVTLSEQNLAGLGATIGPSQSQTFSERLTALKRSSEAENTPNYLSGASSSTESDEIKRIQAMIKDSPDLINARGTGGQTPLHRAADKAQIAVAQFLLANGAEIEARNETSQTPLHLAVERGSRAMAELLLSKKANVNAADKYGKTPLHIAAQKGFRSIVELLIAKGADVNAKSQQEETGLHLAIGNGYKAVAELLISNHADLNSAGYVYAFGNNLYGTPLHVAVMRGDESIARLLLANKASVDAVNTYGKTPLDDAAAAGNTNMMKLLLENGADVNFKNSTSRGTSGGDWTPLHYAVNSGRKDAMAMQLEHGADPNARIATFHFSNQDRKEYTPLLMAAAQGNAEAVELLLAHKADPNLKSLDGDTALVNMITSKQPLERDQVRAVKALLDHGADPSAGRADGYSPLRAAVANGEKEVVKLLIDHKIDLNARSAEPHNEGQTALHVITRLNKNRDLLAIAEMLLDAGADINLPNAYGRTPLSYIETSTDPYFVEMAALFRKHGAVVDMPDFTSIRLTRKGGQTVIVFRQSTNGVNHFTLFEAIANYYNSPGAFSFQNGGSPGSVPSAGGVFTFPDLPRLKIIRPIKGKLAEKQEFPVYVLNATNAFDCARDIPMEFGDVVEIPEREHGLTESLQGLTKAQFDSLRTCLDQSVTFRGRNGAFALETFAIGYPNYLSQATKNSQVQALLTSASDLRHVKLKRTDPKTKKPVEIVEDVQSFWDGKRSAYDDVWLRDGDVVEVPEKP